MGNGAGTFTTSSTYTTGNGPRSISIGDFNGDGKKDVACVNYFSQNISAFLGTGTGSFVSATNIFTIQANPNDLSIADFNNDGKSDVVAANQASASISVLINSSPSVTVSTTNTLLCEGYSAILTVATANSYTWNTGSNSSSIVISPTISTNYTIVGTNGAGCQGGSIFTQSVQVCPNGIFSNTKSENKLNVFPNPFKQNTNVQLELLEKAKVEMTLYNALGQVIENIEAKLLEEGEYIYSIKVRGEGIYILRTTINGYSTTQKIINVE